MEMIKCALFFTTLFLYVSGTFVSVKDKQYQFSVKRLNGNRPVITAQTSGSSIFNYNYNAAFAPLSSRERESGGLFVRCQNNTSTTDPYQVGPSVIAFVKRTSPFTQWDKITYDSIDLSSIMIEPSGPQDSFGCEDPRVVYRESDQTYYLLYSAVANTTGGIPVSKLALATTRNPSDKNSYTLHGPIFPDIKWSKSGSLLIRDGYSGPSYLIWGDSSIVEGLQIATTSDLIHYNNQPGIWLPVRPDKFDSLLVEAGPMPLPLSDGNYLFLYNSARHGYPSKKPNWDVQYNVGWLILDKENPSKILARSDEPIFSPVLDWEIGNYPYLGLTPNVVFVEGWEPVPGKNDTFIFYYGAADSVIGAAELTVKISKVQ